MAELSNEDILKVAKLSNIELTDEEVAKFKQELGSIVGFVEQLQSVDVSGLEPTDQVTGLVNVTRPDEVVPVTDSQALLKNVPQRENDYIKVNRMIG
jgi:aspartyl-tRNA(Asn)/glutamyl-tRNA(Gln) amidotransferase subunit C